MARNMAHGGRHRKGGDTDTPTGLPCDLDPERHRIILQHWYGISPASVVAAETVGDLRFRRQVERLHAKGPRLTAELLAEIGAERSLTSLIEAKVEKYADINDAALNLTGGRSFPPNPLHGVEP